LGAPTSKQRQTDDEYPEYDPVERLHTEVAASGAKINVHIPTAEEIASRKYVRRRYRPVPRWLRWVFGTGKYERKP
jgi:hypothetical protein